MGSSHHIIYSLDKRLLRFCRVPGPYSRRSGEPENKMDRTPTLWC